RREASAAWRSQPLPYSITQHEWIDRTASITEIAHEQVESETRHIVSNRFERGVLGLLEYFYVAMAAVAGFRSHLAVAAFDVLVANSLGRAAERALDAHVVPLGRA